MAVLQMQGVTVCLCTPNCTHTHTQRLHDEKEELERKVEQHAAAAAKDLDLVLDKTIKLEWHKAANTRTRCLRITQKEEKKVRSKLNSGIK